MTRLSRCPIRATVISVVATVAWLVPSLPICAQSTSWSNASGGLWNNNGNWTNGTPTAGQFTIFSNLTSSTHTVTFDISPSTGAVAVRSNNVTWALAGQTYTITANTSIGDGPTLGQLTTTTGTVNAGALSIGVGPGDLGILNVSTASQWSTAGFATIVGDSGTGTLAVINGGNLTTSGIVLGNTAVGTGTFNVTGAGSTVTTTTLTVASGGRGTATISSGGSVTASGNLIVANGANSEGRLTVTGSGSQLIAAGSLNLANTSGASAELTIASGGSIANTSSTLGNQTGTTAAVSVGGTGSTWTNSGSLIVGGLGAGSLDITAGGTVSATSLTLGNTATGSGTMDVSGSGAAFATGGTILIGSTGNGQMTIGTGGTVTTTGTTTVTASTGSLTLSGGTLDTGVFNRLGTFNHQNGTLIVRGIYDHGASASALVIDGNTAAALPTLHLVGTAAVNDVTTVTVGGARRGGLVMSNGRTLNTGVNFISIGNQAGASGAITLTGTGTSLANSGTLGVGGTPVVPGGTGVLNVQNGAAASTGTLMLWGEGTVNLDGGTLNLGALGANGGSFNWTAGTVNFTLNNNLNSAVLTAMLGGAHSLGFGRTLTNAAGVVTTLSSNVSVDGGSLSGVNLINSSTLAVNQGGIAMTGSFTNNAGALTLVQGTGVVSATAGITNSGELQMTSTSARLSGGTLTNSGTLLGTGRIDSTLSNQAAGRIEVVTGQRLVFNGSGNSNAGLISQVGGEVVFNGSLTNAASTGLISGRNAILRFNAGLTNTGSLAFSNGTMDVFGDITQTIGGRITVSGGGVVNFYDDVTIALGANSVQASASGGIVSTAVFFGSYNGGIVGGGTAFIEGDHRPGNSPGLVTFGGDVFYGGLSTLHVELGGLARGSQYDAIDVVGDVNLAGNLVIDLISGFVPGTNNTFLLINNQGSNAVQGTFAGLAEGQQFLADGQLFQISYQGGNGNDVVLTAVPEPATIALFGLLGGSGVGLWRWRRRNRQLVEAETTEEE